MAKEHPLQVPKGSNPLRYFMLMSLWRQYKYQSPFTITNATPTYYSRFLPDECFQATEC